MKFLLHGLVLFLLVFFSCQKEDNPITPVLAGIYDSTMDYMELNPALQVAFIHDPHLNVEYGKDSFDIDLGGSYDIIISQRNLLGTPPSGANSNDTYPFCYLTIKNGVEVATNKECYSIGHGQTSSVNWVDTVAYQTNVAAIVNWSESNRNISMWVSPPTIFWGSDGPWYNLANEEKYVAFRMKTNKRYRYGWIRVMVTSRERMAFFSFAIEK